MTGNMDEQKLRNYARLAVHVGVNLQKGQPLVIGYWRDPVLPPHVEFVRMLVEAGYEAGACFVQVEWGDEWWLRETVRRGDPGLYRARCEEQARWIERLAAEGAAFLRIPASDPDLFAGVDPALVGAAERALNEAFNPFNFRRTNDEYRWSLISAPTQAWADKVHPGLPQERRVVALWEDILVCARSAGEDPISDWHAHRQNLQRRRDWLNRLRIRELHYEAPGTDLRVALPERHHWKAAGDEGRDGVPFIANIPTEEVYTVPHKAGVRGVVTSTLPLNHSGALIEGIRLRFEGGRIVEYGATKGLDALRQIVEMDEGSHYLGEIALVPVNSPIAERGTLFYNTLFDENASCHLAIGKAYALIEGGTGLDRSEWERHGLNDSLMHVDFMIGSAQMNIAAVTQEGQEVPIFRAGRWAADV